MKAGDLLIELSAPEMSAQIAEAESKVQIAESERLQAEAKLTSMQASLASLEATQASSQATYDRLKTASQTAGAVSGNEVDVALRLVESQRAGIEAQRGSIQAQRASIEALRSGKAAAEASLSAVQDMKAYLRVTAPFDGVVTDRLVHPGALVGPNSNVALTGDPTGFDVAAHRGGTRGKCGKYRSGSQSGFSCSRLSQPDVFRNHSQAFARAGSKNAFNGGGVGCCEQGSVARSGNVSDGDLAGAEFATGALCSENQCRHDHGTNICRA